MSVKFLIGVDQALRNTGVSVHDHMQNEIETFNIQTATGTPDDRAIDYIVEQFFKRLAPYFVRHKGQQIARVYMEDITYTRHGDKTHARSECAGALKWNMRQDNIPHYGMSPGALNSFLFDRHGVKPASRKSKDIKAATMAVLHSRYNFYTEDDNKADAYVAALFGHAHAIDKQKLACRPLFRVL